MGAIVSHRKDPKRRNRLEQKAIAVNAFSGKNSKTDETSQPKTEDTSIQTPQPDSRTGSTTNIAVASWGEGVIGTSTHALHNKGVVSSRGVEKDVKSSKELYPTLKPRTPDLNRNQAVKKDELYTDFARVTPIPSRPSADDAAVTIQSTFRGYKARKKLETERYAAINIQRHVRGYQSRKEIDKKEQSAKIIQRGFRNHLSRGDSDDEKSTGHRRPWRESTTAAPVLDVQIGEKTKESFNMYQEDITDLKWKTEQQIEQTTMGEDFSPPRIVIISSNVPRSDVLEKIVRDDVLRFGYDFSNASLQDILDNIAATLERFKSRSRARSIALVCAGGPGYFNPVKGKMITQAKVEQDEEIKSFWKSLGTYMTKLNPEETIIHVIGNNVTGNKKGEKLMKYLTKTMKPSVVKVESPLELGPTGREMLALYFDHEKYKIWKSRMHSKVSFKL